MKYGSRSSKPGVAPATTSTGGGCRGGACHRLCSSVYAALAREYCCAWKTGGQAGTASPPSPRTPTHPPSRLGESPQALPSLAPRGSQSTRARGTWTGAVQSGVHQYIAGAARSLHACQQAGMPLPRCTPSPALPHPPCLSTNGQDGCGLRRAACMPSVALEQSAMQPVKRLLPRPSLHSRAHLLLAPAAAANS